MVRSRSSGGIAVLFRRQAGRQINLTGLGIEAHSRQRASEPAGHFSEGMAMITWLSSTSMLQAQGLSSSSSSGSDFGVEADQAGVGGYTSASKRLSDRRPQQTLLVGGFLIGNRCQTLPPTEVERSRHLWNFRSRTPSRPMARHARRDSLSLFRSHPRRPRAT